ncbi:zinc-binding dehydrogenase [Bacillus thermotolerans]|uniref:Alcohol dehydrogenase n=1 Tax=Bacillus thermotolerans TaxID=1221996 RepID=A0A0F5I091_BACTR|nr:zinc-binding dehydrogenase [Bacillus thermotolerans]KKB34174.1 Alcohol dehydrogenase [Bacillus thermotolerans]KKB37297.1 Alcohol dehydrogenase [Bacillus thermotolerans]KKB39059.1 Alcohol dehydrogenase [Bacillus thermotolerans]
MKAIILRETGGPQKLSYEELPTPAPKEGEVLVRLKYASLNRRDVWITYGQYPGMQLPAILGSDGSGEVAAVGEGVKNIKEGSEVVIYPSLNWGENQSFNDSRHTVLGMPSDGTYAQYVAVPAENVYPKPDYLSLEEAAALPLSALTAYRAVAVRGEVKEGETVLIPGIGSGVALYALQIAVSLGAKVFVTSSDDEKIKRAVELGAAGGVNYGSDTYVKELKKLMGQADVSIDGVGGSTFNDLIYLSKPGARIVNFGSTAGPVPELVLPRLFFKHLDVKGTTMGSPKDFEEMLQFFAKHEIRPIIDRAFPLEQAEEAQLYMEKGKQFGKIMLEIPEAE